MPANSASFFDYDPNLGECGGYRWIQLSRAETVESSHTERTEEGWTGTYLRWYLDGADVVCEYATDGRDCDGRLSTFVEYRCSVDKLDANKREDRPFGTPEWQETGSRQRDYSAEVAGY